MLPAVFKRHGPPLAQQNMLLTRLMPLFKSKASFFWDHSIKPLQGCAVFSFRLFLFSSEKKRKKFDLTTAVTAHVQTSAWPGELLVSLLPLYVQCAIRSCLIFDSLRHHSGSTDIHCFASSGHPSRGRPLYMCWCSSNSPLSHASA